MLQNNQLVTQIKNQVLSQVNPPPVGEIYRFLCEAFPLLRLQHKKHHQAAQTFYNKLLDYLQKTSISASYRKQILRYLDGLAYFISDYEKDFLTSLGKSPTGEELLEHLMEEHGLKQSDLKEELGSQSVVSEILSGKRKLNLRQIKALAKRFGVSPGTFV